MILSNVWHCCGRKNRKATKAAMQIAAAFAVHLINKMSNTTDWSSMAWSMGGRSSGA